MIHSHVLTDLLFWPFVILPKLGVRFIPDKEDELVAVDCQTPQELQVGELVCRHGLVYLRVHLVEISVGFLLRICPIFNLQKNGFKHFYH